MTKIFNWLLTVSLLLTYSNLVKADEIARFTLPSGVKVEIIEAPFLKKNFKLKGCSSQEPVCEINGNLPYGSDLELPKTFVKSIRVSISDKSYTLDSRDMYNAWGKRPLEYEQNGKVRYFGGNCYDKLNCQFRGMFSDAAGSFVAEWKIVQGTPSRTVLTNSSDIIHLFMENIDPPVFE